MPDLLHALNSGRVLLMDGAMGTELQKAGIKPGECYELWNLTHPERVRSIHQSYLQAGSDCLLTNSFQASPIALARFGLEQRLDDINRAAVQLARSARRGDHFVLASIGPLDLTGGSEGLRDTISSLSEADGLLLETWSGQYEVAARYAIDPVINPRRLPVLLSLAFDASPSAIGEPRLLGCELTSTTCADRLSHIGLAAIGANCGRAMDLDRMRDVITGFRASNRLPLLVRPNAGPPALEQGDWKYNLTPEAFAAGALHLIAAGGQLIGGCCGTTPQHIAALAACLKRGVSD